jgi:hypothetical protein
MRVLVMALSCVPPLDTAVARETAAFDWDDTTLLLLTVLVVQLLTVHRLAALERLFRRTGEDGHSVHQPRRASSPGSVKDELWTTIH